MSILLGDNFKYYAGKPLDARLKYDTIAAMASMSASTLYDGIIAYCSEDGKTYQWKSGNTTDPTLGKWREFETGGSGVPAGGTEGQVLAKASNDDGDVEWADVGVDTVPVMAGATSTSDGAKGLAPKPYIADRNKFLCGDGTYKNVYTSSDGAVVNVTCAESAFFGKTVTMTDGVDTVTGTLSASGECTFTDVLMSSGITISAEDGNGNTARGTISITYFGVYNVNITSNVSLIHVTTEDTRLFGRTITVSLNNQVVTTSAFSLEGSADIYVNATGIYTLQSSFNDIVRHTNVSVLALNTTYNAEIMVYSIYAYQIDENDSNPATCVTPYESEWGCDNLNFTPAHMDFANDTFVMGSWTGNEFFFPKPCMLKYDGTVDYYLDPTDYTKKADGTASDVANFAYNGNVMVEFPTVYFNRWQASGRTYVVMSDKQLTSDFHAYAHHDKNGNVLPYIYLAAYDGSYDGTRLRSISGKACHNKNALTSGYIMSNATRQQEINFAVANNNGIADGHEGYYTTHKADGDLVIDLLTLIGYSTNSQATFGRGRDTGFVSTTNTGIVTTGSMNTKGMFWGENQGAAGVKVFGIENFWGNLWKQRAGWINANGTQKVKMTWGQEDGSTVDGFNTTGSGYVTISGATPAGTTGGYINKWKKTAQGFIPYNAAGSDSTYMCDVLSYYNSQVACAICGGDSNNGLSAGAFSSFIAYTDSNAYWFLGATLSCK